MSNQKGFLKVAVIIIVLILIGGAYFVFSKKSDNIELLPLSNNDNTSILPDPLKELTFEESLLMETSGWKTYRNDQYGFEIKYPSVWTLRDGNKDYKSTGLNNFYQFCNKVITNHDEPLSPNDNFVGLCEDEYLRVNVWKPTAEMKMITNDFAPLKFDEENKITIGGKLASDFTYSGHSEILGGAHTWHLFIVQTNNYIYSITGDSCMDNKTDCNKILSTFKFTN